MDERRLDKESIGRTKPRIRSRSLNARAASSDGRVNRVGVLDAAPARYNGILARL
jgi:hypothetical protein